MRYRLLKSGPQGGADAVSDPLAPALLVAMEGKRYEQGTPLPLDELRAKIHDAADRQEDLDLWIVAATREISAGDADALREVGNRRGVAVEILDTPATPGVVPELAYLCAMFPELAAAHLANATRVAASLEWIKALPTFAERTSQLAQRLTHPELGYANARRLAHQWLQDAMSDAATAKAYLGGYIDILTPGSKRISRARLDRQLDDWWENKRGQLLALLGDEGMGKTWEALGWWLARRGAGGTVLPLTLFIPVGDVSTKDPEVLIAEALHKCTGLRDVAFWRRRVKTWVRNTAPNQPRLLLLIDGLNQNPFFGAWGELLQRLFAPPFVGNVAVIVTDRPDDWKNRLGTLADLTPGAHTVTVSAFSDDELDQLLAANSLARSDFEPALLDLLGVPRLCQLAVRLRRELHDSGDITRERLIFEDWKDRIRRRARDVRMNNAEFRDWVAEVGRRIQQDLRSGTETAVTRRELVAQLGRDSGASDFDLHATISEIVDGRWLEPVGAHRFRVRPGLAPLALGLALAEHLKQSSHVPPGAAIAEFIDQLRGQDIAVSILRAASTAAFVDREVPLAIRTALTLAWVTAPNFDPRDFEALWRLTPLAPEAICDVAEHFWASATGGHFRDEVLIKAFANAYKWRTVALTLEARCTTWLGLYKSDPRASATKPTVSSDGSEERRRRTNERRATWDAASVFPANTTPIECRDGVESSWLAHRAIAVLSHLPRRPFVRALRTWAVSRAIIATPEEFEEVAWLLRWNPEDPLDTEAALLDESNTLLRANNPIATTAAGYLLKALATRRALDIAEAHQLLSSSPFARPRSDRITVTNGVIDWPRDEGSAEPNTPSLRRLRDLVEYALDPEVELPAGAVDVLRQCADATDISTLWRTSGMTEADHAVDVAAPVLARWAPVALADLVRRAFGEGRSRTGDALAGLAFALRRSLLFLGQEQLDAIADIITRDDVHPSLRDTLAIALFRNQAASRQAELLLGAGRGIDIWDARRLFSAVQDSDLPFLTTCLDATHPPEGLVRVLEFLVAAQAQLPQGYAPLMLLIEHSDPQVRGFALMLIWQLKDSVLDGAIRDKWAFDSGMTLPERKYGSLILCRTATDGDVTSVIQRIDPQALGYLATHSGSSEAQSAFKNYVQAQVELLARGEGPISFLAFWADDLGATSTAIGALVRTSADEVFSWFAPLMSNGAHLQAHEEFPFVLICRQLLTHAPEKGAVLWNKLHDLSHASSMRFQIEGFDTMPFAVPDSPAVSALRTKVLNSAKTDGELASSTTAACENQAHTWLIHHVEEALKQDVVGDVARAITVAGLLDNSPEADRLWAEALTASPAAGWLAEVRSHAYADYQDNIRARYWFERFLREPDHDKAHGAYLLFLASVDGRAVEWAPRVIGSRSDQTPTAHRAHHALCWPEVRKRAETRARERERTLFHTDIPSRLQAPWVR